MTKVLITGATGNVGREVLNSLQKIDHQLDLYTGVRDIHVYEIGLNNNKIKLLQFDFTDLTLMKPRLLVATFFFYYDHHKYQT